jgi:hypothetical protein
VVAGDDDGQLGGIRPTQARMRRSDRSVVLDCDEPEHVRPRLNEPANLLSIKRLDDPKEAAVAVLFLVRSRMLR